MNRYATGKLVAWGVVALAAEVTLLESWSVKGARAEALLALACFAALFVSITAGGVPFGVMASKTLVSALLTAALTPPLLFFFTQARWSVR